jgi:hypothetical protein
MEEFIKDLITKNKELHSVVTQLRSSQQRAMKNKSLVRSFLDHFANLLQAFLRSESVEAFKHLRQIHCKMILDEIINKCFEVVEEKRAHAFKIEDPRTPPPKWVSDDSTSQCTKCRQPFTFFSRRHHCRYCGEVSLIRLRFFVRLSFKIFCSDCTSYRRAIPQFSIFTPVRVCQSCDTKLANTVDAPLAVSPKQFESMAIMATLAVPQETRQRSKSVG